MLSEEAANYYIDNPYDFVVDQIGVTPSKQQEQVLRAIPRAIKERKFISVRSGHGTGKTALQAWIQMWFLATRPNPRIPCTAPTQHQLYDILWSEINKWHNKWNFKDYFYWTSTHFSKRGFEKNWFSVAVTSSTADGMQGFHEDHMIFMVDEASGVPDMIFEVIQGALTTQEAICIMFGNPTKTSGFFSDTFTKYRSRTICFTFNAEESTNVSKESCRDILDLCGGDRDHDMYRVRVRGLPPKDDPDSLIPLEKCEIAAANDILADGNKVEIGVDVARFGGDETVITCRRGLKVLKQLTYQKQDLMATTGCVVQAIREFEGYKVRVNIDDTGLGGGVTDRLKELRHKQVHHADVYPINNGSKATDTKRFVNRGAELWFNMVHLIETLDIPNDPKLISQLSSRKYDIKDSNGKDSLESKHSMKKRGFASPDKADSLVLACCSFVKENKVRKHSFGIY